MQIKIIHETKKVFSNIKLQDSNWILPPIRCWFSFILHQLLYSLHSGGGWQQILWSELSRQQISVKTYNNNPL